MTMTENHLVFKENTAIAADKAVLPDNWNQATDIPGNVGNFARKMAFKSHCPNWQPEPWQLNKLQGISAVLAFACPQVEGRS